MAERINPHDIEVDARTWNHWWERVAVTEAVDAILQGVFQGKKDGLREQMLDVAAKRVRRIDWGSADEMDEQRRADIIARAKAILDAREGNTDGPDGTA